MIKEFFYLDGKDQKGPFTIDQLKQVGLKPDTLVWTEEFESWKPAKDVLELADLIKKIPPPPPIIDSYQSVTVATNENPTKTKPLVEDSNVKLWATVKIISLIFLLFIGVAFIGYSFINSKRTKLKKEISEKIAYVFGTKSQVLDGEKTGVQGEEKATNYKKKNTKIKEKQNCIKFGKDSVLLNNIGLFNWEERDGLYTVFKCTNGGFTIKKLTKLNDESFDLETYYSGDMGYRKPEFTRGVTRWSYNEFGENNTYGNIRNYRKSVQSYYDEAFDFFTKDDKTGAYTAGKLIDITTFPDISNEYFYMDNTKPKLYSSSGHFSSDWGPSDDHSGNIFWEDARVYYSSKGKHYELTLKEDKFKKDLLLTIGISCGILLILVIVISISKPKFFRNLLLFGKRWKNISYEDQVLFFEHYFFTSHKFTEMINENVSKGILKITDKGNTINLSYSNKELFYKIEKIDLDNLTLVSLKDGSSITFLRIGAKQREVVKQTVTTNQEEPKNQKTNQ